MGVFGRYIGKFKISEEKKPLFIRQLSKVLNYGGMMQFDSVKMYDHQIYFLQPVELHSEKKEEFHYNYFEDDFWESVYFNKETLSLSSGKIGSSQFASVMMTAYFLYEVWDENYGYAEYNGDPVRSDEFCIGWLNHILGTDFSSKKRFCLWNMMETYLEDIKKNENEYWYQYFCTDVIFSMIPYEKTIGAGGTDLADLLYIAYGTDSLEEEEIVKGSYPEQILMCKKAIMELLENGKEEAVSSIWELLKKPYRSREEETDAELKELAKYTLYLPARVIVYLVAEIRKEEFWPLWWDVKDTVYKDERKREYAPDYIDNSRKGKKNSLIKPYSTARFLREENDDNRLYWWDGSDEVKISKETEEWIQGLAGKHKKLMESLPDREEDFLKELLKTLDEINDYYKDVYCFKSMFYEFLEHRTEKEYLAALLLLKKTAESDENKKAGAVMSNIDYHGKDWYDWNWNRKKFTHNIGRLRMKRYLSIMANLKLRKKYFGF